MDEAAQGPLEAAMAGLRPHQVVAYGLPGVPAVPLLEDQGLVDGPGERARLAAYVCRDSACRAPVTEVEAL